MFVYIYILQYNSMTNEGGRLRKDTVLMRGKDFEIVPETIWRALTTWYGGSPALPRTVSLRGVASFCFFEFDLVSYNSSL